MAIVLSCLDVQQALVEATEAKSQKREKQIPRSSGILSCLALERWGNRKQCAGHGYDVTLYDVDSSILRGAKDQAAGILDWLSAQGHIRPGEEAQS